MNSWLSKTALLIDCAVFLLKSGMLKTGSVIKINIIICRKVPVSLDSSQLRQNFVS